jgi:16S rRNA (uracil1498-N3)-methyltransferase
MPGEPPRLFTQAALGSGADIVCEPQQGNYLVNVLRRKVGDTVLLFNGRDGEWRAGIAVARRSSCILRASVQTRPQDRPQDIHYLFAPLKHARLDYMVQKATEMGVSALRPVLTAHTVAARVNLERMRANCIEAAEQCGLLAVPEVMGPETLETVLEGWDVRRTLIYCDEAAQREPPVRALAAVEPGPLAVLIGPEGGFSAAERDILRARPYVQAISLGPRIMRADTAAVAALGIVNAVLGDWAA